ncbi:hypothetical protein ACPCHT_08580 [Nucisporomicrobium flavum]|uniref:hypothetical protein n=1 Tax=Nucisporomicrobium flavum TaxID=2785915 RepID=UPI003C2B5D74
MISSDVPAAATVKPGGGIPPNYSRGVLEAPGQRCPRPGSRRGSAPEEGGHGEDPRCSRSSAVFGTAGNVAYGFNIIHVSLGDTDLVDAPGAAALIKPLGLLFPLAILLSAWVLRRIARPWATVTLAVAGVAWPVAHIADIAWLAVLTNLALVVVFGALAMRQTQPAPDRPVPGRMRRRVRA